MQRQEIRASMNVGRSFVKDGVNMLSKEEEKELELLYIKVLEELEENKNESKDIQPHECG